MATFFFLVSLHYAHNSISPQWCLQMPACNQHNMVPPLVGLRLQWRSVEQFDMYIIYTHVPR